MLKAKPAGILGPLPSLQLLTTALLIAGLAALLLWAPGPAQARDGEPPPVEPGWHHLSVAYSLQDHVTFNAGNYALSAGAAADTLRGQLQGAPAQSPVVACQPSAGDDYDADDDGLIEVCNLAQLDAIRFDLGGNGSASGSALADAGAKYQAAFPGIVDNGPGCPQSGCKGYELTVGLDFDSNGNGEADYGDAYWNGGKGWLSIGRYAAVFEGNGHTVSNLHSRAEVGRQGLFQTLAKTGVIRNVILKNVNVAGHKSCIGGLVGENWGTISSAGVTGTVSGHWRVGGLVGWNRSGGTITDSYSSGEVSGSGDIMGGLAGENRGGRIARSWSTANVTTGRPGNYSVGWHVGGLVGWNQGSIVGSYATGRVTGNNRGTGGLVGYNYGDIFASYATGHVSSSGSSVGGLVGFNAGHISASFALGAVSGGANVRGLVGSHTTLWTAVNENHHRCIGCSIPNAIPGYGDRSGITASYWNTQAPGQTATRGLRLQRISDYTPKCTGRTTAELRRPTDYTGIYALWDDLRDFSGDSYAWDFGTSLDFPVLRDTGPSVAAQRALLPDAPDPSERYAALIVKMKEWRNDPQYVDDQEHTDRWDRALLAFGETVADTTLTPMTAAEVQGYADRGWTRWMEVAAALRQPECAGQPDPANRPPTVASAPADATIVNESGTQAVSLSGVFDDADNDPLTVTAASSDETVATASVASDYSTLTVNAHSRGEAQITVTADDGNGGIVSDTFTVRVKAAPLVASAISDLSGLEKGAEQDVSLSGVFSDPDGDSLTISAVSSDDAIATATVAADQSTLTVAGVAEGAVTITVTVQDADGNRVSDGFDVSVGGKYAALIAQMYEWRNDPCCANDQAHTDRWDRALLAFGETVADTTLTPMTATEAQGYADSGWTRWADVAAALEELESGGQPDPANRPPTVSAAIADATIVNESRTHQVSLAGVFDDADNDPLTITAAPSDEAVATVSVASDYSSLTVMAQARGTATVTATAADGRGGTVSDTFTVRVKAAPVVASAIADVSGLEVDATQNVSLSGVFSDADGDPLTIRARSSGEAIATATVSSNGSALTLAGVAEGTVTITVTAQDSDGNRVSDAFDVSVEPEPDEGEQDPDPPTGAPTVAAPLADISLEGPELREISLTGVFHDPDGDDLTFTAASSATHVAATLHVEGSTLKVMGTGTGTATITVTAEDPDGNQVSDTFEVTVRPAS